MPTPSSVAWPPSSTHDGDPKHARGTIRVSTYLSTRLPTPYTQDKLKLLSRPGDLSIEQICKSVLLIHLCFPYECRRMLYFTFYTALMHQCVVTAQIPPFLDAIM